MGEGAFKTSKKTLRSPRKEDVYPSEQMEGGDGREEVRGIKELGRILG